MAEAPPSDRLEALLAHREWARGLARALVRDDADAADLEQEVWLSAVRRPPGDVSSPRGWLATAMRHALSNLRRGRRRRGARERAAARPEAAPAADAVVAEAEAHRRVVDAVMDLEEPYRTAVLLRFFEGLDLPAVAARTGVPSETARTRLKRARERLRGRLGLALLPLLRETPPPGAAPLLPVAGGIAMTLKTKAAVGACAALLLLLVGAALLGGDGPPPAPAAAGDAPVETATAEPAVPPPLTAAPPAPPPPAVEHVLRVRVVDEAGEAVPGVRFLVGAKEDPLAGEADAGRVWNLGTSRGGMQGREVEADANGRWQRVFPGPRQLVLWVSTGADPGIRAAAEPGSPARELWVDTPAPDVVLRVRRVPTAVLVVRARDLSTGRFAQGFQVSVTVPGGGGPYSSRRADGESLEARVAVPEGGRVLVTLLDPKPFEPAEEEASLEPEGRTEVTLRFRTNAEVRGRVVGPDGLPVRDAWVWIGGQDVARGDEPFKPFQEKRVRGGARTSPLGEFHVRGTGRLVSAWHPDLSPATVPLEAASEIRLAARGSIRGVIVDGRGAPRAGVAVVLERGPEAATAEDGSFLFEKVEAGPRGLLVEKRRWVVVRVEPGQEVRPEIGPGLEQVAIRLQAGPRPWSGSKGIGVLLPLGAVGTVHEIKGLGPRIRVEGVIPGPYLLLGAEGHFATLQVEEPDVRVDLGTSSLLVRALPKAPVFVFPAGKIVEAGGPLVELFARRVQRLAPSGAGEVRVAPLPAAEVIVEAGPAEKAERRARQLEPGLEATVDARPPGGE